MANKIYSFDAKVSSIGILAISIELLESNGDDASKVKIKMKESIGDLVETNSKDLYGIFKDIKS